MQDSWCEKIWNGTRYLSGAAAREYRVSMAGGVEHLIRETSREASEAAARKVLETVNGTIKAVNTPNTNVVAGPRPAVRRRSRNADAEKAREKK